MSAGRPPSAASSADLADSSGVLERLALQDIWHGEADVTMEWDIVLLSFPVILRFYVACFVTAILRAKATTPGQATP